MIHNYRVVPLKRWHIDWLLDDGKAEGGFSMDRAALLALEKMPNNWTGVYGADPIACGGIIEQWAGRYTAWMYLNANSGRHMFYITKQVLKVLSGVKGRIELTVRKDFELGHRWAKLLGFEVESPLLQAYGPEGEDHVGYVRFNG